MQCVVLEHAPWVSQQFWLQLLWVLSQRDWSLVHHFRWLVLGHDRLVLHATILTMILTMRKSRSNRTKVCRDCPTPGRRRLVLGDRWMSILPSCRLLRLVRHVHHRVKTEPGGLWSTTSALVSGYA